MKSDETSRFLALQSRLRGEITTLRPVDLKDIEGEERVE